MASDFDKKYGKGEKEQDSNKKEGKTKLKQLQEDLKTAIKEERYEDAAKIRDEIKKCNGDGPEMH